MELEGDHAVVRSLQLLQKAALPDLPEDPRHFSLALLMRGDQGVQIFAKGLLRAGITAAFTLISAVGGVVVELVLLKGKDFFIMFRKLPADPGFEKTQIRPVLFIKGDLCLTQRGMAFQHLRKPCRIVNIFQLKEQIHPVSERRTQTVEQLIQIVFQRYLADLFGIKAFVGKQQGELDAALSGQKVDYRRQLDRSVVFVGAAPGSLQQLLLFSHANVISRKGRDKGLFIRNRKRHGIRFFQGPLQFGQHRFHRDDLVIFPGRSVEKMPPTFQNVVQGKIYQADIMRLIRLHQLLPEMIDRGVSAMVVLVCKGGIVKQGKPAAAVRLVVQPQGALFHAAQEQRVDLGNLFREEQFKDPKPLVPSGQAAPRHAAAPSAGGILRFIKQPGAPHGIPVELQYPILRVCNGPAYRVGANVQTEIVFACLLVVSVLLHEKTLLDNRSGRLYNAIDLELPLEITLQVQISLQRNHRICELTVCEKKPRKGLFYLLWGLQIKEAGEIPSHIHYISTESILQGINLSALCVERLALSPPQRKQQRLSPLLFPYPGRSFACPYSSFRFRNRYSSSSFFTFSGISRPTGQTAAWAIRRVNSAIKAMSFCSCSMLSTSGRS